MSPRSQRAFAQEGNAAELRTSVAPVLSIIHENHEPVQTDLDIREKWKLSKELSRRVALDAGGRRVGNRIAVATQDLLAYIRAEGTPAPMPPRRAAKPRLVTTKAKPLTAADVARANGFPVKGGVE